MSTDILHEAEADLADLIGLPGAIRDKVRAGVAELRRLHDAIEAELARLTGGAKATLDALQALAPLQAATTPEATPPAGDPPPPPVPAEDTRAAIAF